MNRLELKYGINKLISSIFPVSSEHFGYPRRKSTVKAYCEEYPENIYLPIHTDVKLNAVESLPDVFGCLGHVQERDLFVAELLGARVWGSLGTVIAKHDIILTDVSYYFSDKRDIEHPVFYIFRQGPITDFHGRAAVISHPGASVYYHWMVDILPRVGVLALSGKLGTAERIICDYTGLPFQQETLSKAGIDEKSILRCHDYWRFHMRFDKLLVPSLAGNADMPGDFQIQYLRNLYSDLLNESARPERKFYVSRRGAGTRELIQEEPVVDVLVKRGFEVVFCEKMTVREQILLFSSASVIIGPHGSAFTNLVFCMPGTRVVELLNDSQLNPCFAIIASKLGLDYMHFKGKSVKKDSNYKNDHISIDIDLFFSFLKVKEVI